MTINDLLRRDLRAQLEPTWAGTDDELEERIDQLIAEIRETDLALRDRRLGRRQ